MGSVQDHLASDPEALGDIAHKGDLPFLFKVISINKALSIQVNLISFTLWVEACVH